MNESQISTGIEEDYRGYLDRQVCINHCQDSGDERKHVVPDRNRRGTASAMYTDHRY